jgi:hypothetical protein
VEPGSDGTATAEGEGADGDDEERGDGAADAEDTPDPNAGKTAEERGAARRRKKGAAVDEAKAKANGKKPPGAGSGTAGAVEDGAEDAGTGEGTEEAEMVPGGRAEVGEETRVTLQTLEEATLEDDGEGGEGADQLAVAELTPDEVDAARAAAAVSLAEWRELSAGGVGGGFRAQVTLSPTP